MALDSSSVSAIYEYPLLIFHVGSFAVISILQCQGKELDKPKDEKNKPERNPSDPIAHCMLARWIPLQRTSVLMEVTALAAVGRLVVKIYTFQGDWVIIVIHVHTSATMYIICEIIGTCASLLCITTALQ